MNMNRVDIRARGLSFVIPEEQRRAYQKQPRFLSSYKKAIIATLNDSLKDILDITMGNTESQVVIMDNGSRRNSRRSSRLKKKTSTAQESDEIKTDTVDKDIDRVEFPEIEDLPAPPLTSNDRKLIVRSWTIVDQQISQVRQDF